MVFIFYKFKFVEVKVIEKGEGFEKKIFFSLKRGFFGLEGVFVDVIVGDFLNFRRKFRERWFLGVFRGIDYMVSFFKNFCVLGRI